MAGSRRPFLRRVVEGVELFRCTNCLGWKKRESFRKNPKTWSGITTQCKDCLRRKEAKHLEENGERLRQRRRDRYATQRKLELEGIERERRQGRYGPIRVPTRLVQPWAMTLRNELGSWASVGQLVGLHADSVNKLGLGTYPSTTVDLEVAERLAAETGHSTELWDHIPMPGKEDWGPNGERFCVRCGTFERPFHAKGMCRKCYSVVAYHQARGQEPPLPRQERWSTWHLSCVRCSTIEHRHEAHGLCTKCYHFLYHAGMLKEFLRTL